jgi:hypothetical protein
MEQQRKRVKEKESEREREILHCYGFFRALAHCMAGGLILGQASELEDLDASWLGLENGGTGVGTRGPGCLLVGAGERGDRGTRWRRQVLLC